MKRLVLYLIAGPAILLLAFMLIPAISDNGRPSPKAKCILEMRLISDALHQYRKDVGEYPTGKTESILQQLRATNALGNHYLLYPFRKGYSIHEFVDPWGTPFRIEISQASNFVVHSAGKNRQFGDGNDLYFSSSSNNLVNP